MNGKILNSAMEYCNHLLKQKFIHCVCITELLILSDVPSEIAAASCVVIQFVGALEPLGSSWSDSGY